MWTNSYHHLEEFCKVKRRHPKSYHIPESSLLKSIWAEFDVPPGRTLESE